MRIDIWYDLVCPFCHLGKRHFELALADFPHRDEVEVVWRSFELDRNAPARLEGSNIERVAAKYGTTIEQTIAQHEHMAADAAKVGLDFNWEKVVGSNSFDAHRVIQFARVQDLEGPVTERIMRGWYSEGAAIGERDELIELAVDGGLDRVEVTQMLESDAFGREVREDEALANEIGISSVPTFVLDQKYAVVGAQPVDVLRDAIAQVWERRGEAPEQRAGGCGGCGCGAGGCGS